MEERTAEWVAMEAGRRGWWTMETAAEWMERAERGEVDVEWWAQWMEMEAAATEERTG